MRAFSEINRHMVGTEKSIARVEHRGCAFSIKSRAWDRTRECIYTGCALIEGAFIES